MMCFITAAACCILMAASPPQGQEGAILYLTGAQSLEELDSSVLEHFESLLSHPIRINFASRQVLESSMLLDRLQIMTLMDYRRLQGDILSAYELSLVPGFGAESAAMLAPFLDFSTSSAPGRSSMDAVSHAEACLRYRSDGLSFKGSYDWKGCLTASAGFSTSPTASLSYHAPAGALNLTAGDFNVRLGQGLCAWTGFSMSSLGNVASFSKRSGGIIPGTGYSRSGRLRGAALNYDTGRWAFTGFLAGESGACLSYYWNSGQAGINFFSGRLSADSRITAGRFDLFGELCTDLHGGGLDAVAGTILNTSYDVKWALRARIIHEKELSIAAGARLYGTDLTAELAQLPLKEGWQFRGKGCVPLSLTPWWKLTLRTDARFRSYDKYNWRTLLRADSEFRYGSFTTLLRADRLHCRSESIVLLAEQGYSDERFSLWLRGMVFRADYWDDRIYVWQRDIPGSFNVPAMYGRGWRLSLCGRVKLFWGRLDLQASHTGCIDDRAASDELKLLYRLTF